MLDPTLWQALEQRGVLVEHLEVLLRFLDCNRHGRFEWHGRNGHLDHCELHLTWPARGHDLRAMRDLALWEMDGSEKSS